MQALTFDPNRNRFTLKKQPLPTPGPGEVQLKVVACGLNPVDSKISEWKHLAPDMDDNWVPGLDVSGVITELGEGVKQWEVGDRVLYHGDMLKPHGGFSEYALHNAQTLLPHPNIDPIKAAATPCAGWTAWRALTDKLRLDPQDSLLIAGGSGGVGSFALQIARILGVRTVIASCSEKNRDHVLSLGASHTVDYHTQDLVQEVMQLTGQQGVTKGVDTVGGDNDILVADSLAYEGEMVELVQLVRPERYRDSFLRGLTFHQLSLGSGHRHGAKAAATMIRAGIAFNQQLEQGKIQVPISQVISIEEVADALESIRSQRTVGKIVMHNAP